MIELVPGVDYRAPDKRETAFLAYYEAMLHTGELIQQLRLVDWYIEQTTEPGEKRDEKKLWAAWLWGATYNLTGLWAILQTFPEVPDREAFTEWYNANFDRIRFDTDCRYRKSKMIACLDSWRSLSSDVPAARVTASLSLSEAANFKRLWDWSMSVKYFGRLACWNHVEAMGYVMRGRWKVDAPDLMLKDIRNSESNRNGVAWVTGNESLATHHGKLETGNTINERELDYLVARSDYLWSRALDALSLTVPTAMNVLNFETALCWSKKMMSRTTHSRYLGWDGDRTWDEIKYLEKHWPELDTTPLWAARDAMVPRTLLCEHYPKGWHRGVDKGRMKRFYQTGSLPEVMAWQRGELCRGS
ncbi:MAG: hypothetical protein Unbinned4944contig1000_4 [Prokaryotic dsDNA virus sp.]|nr:MAG: hypothetical protein Unbinned4944contig1000_4 [Prokaryotic dsDNA virus sp.]